MPIVVVFPVPLTPTTSRTLGRSRDVECSRLAEHRRRLLDERLGQVSDLAARLEPPDELGRGRHADVGRDQRLLEALPGLVVGRVEGRGRELVGERTAALAQRIP